MQTRLILIWDNLRSTFWFIPSAMTFLAIALSVATVEADHRLTSQAVQEAGWVWFGGADGARQMLSAIATSMVTVAGVSFSITIVALTMASSQFGPRLLSNFMRDNGNQFVLGTFIATFVYCLFVLRTIRSVGESPFVPFVSVTTGFFLGVGSVIVLIYFIHHVSAMIQAENLVAAVATELNAGLEKIFPETIGTEMPNMEASETAEGKCRTATGEAIEAGRSGYLQAVDDETLVRVAVQNDLVIHLAVRPGDFVTRKITVATCSPAKRVTADVVSIIQEAIIVGTFRTPTQDVEYSMRQMVEIAVRALSPSLNDPFTAIGCLDWLGAALTKVCERDLPSSCRYDSEGNLRVVAPRVDFREIAGSCFSDIRRYAKSHENVLFHLLKVIDTVGRSAVRHEDRMILCEHVRAVMTDASLAVLPPAGVKRIEERAKELLAVFERGRG